MDIRLRQALMNEVITALNLALDVFMEFEAHLYTKEAIGKFVDGCVKNEEYINNYISGKHMMFIALDGQKIVGIINERGNGRISMLFVDSKYQRQGIASELMDKMIEYFRKIQIHTVTLDSSPYAVSFYHHYGFVDTDKEQCNDGFIFTPMSYEISEN